MQIRVKLNSLSLALTIFALGTQVLASTETVVNPLGSSESPSIPQSALPPPTSGNSEKPAGIAASAAIQSALVSSLPLGPSTIADIAQSVAPAVVSIDVDKKQRVAIPEYPGFPFEFFFNGRRISPNGGGSGNGMGRGNGGSNGNNLAPFFPDFHAQNMGSGFIIRSNGYILTNAHVVKGADKINVTLNDGRHFSGTVLGTDSFTDIAVVKIAAENLPVARFGTNKGLRPGDFCIAIGSPLGYDHSVTFGIISALERDVRQVNEHVRFIQTDAAINPGNSGGPLLNLAGDVIGINTAIHANAQNLGFSIPIDTVRGVIDDLINGRKIKRPYLGIVMDSVSDIELKSLGLPITTKGVFIKGVNEGPAKTAGVTQGDIIQKIDGKDVSTPRDIQDLVRSHKVGDKLHLLVMRQNQVSAIACDVGQYPESVSSVGQDPEDE